MDFIISRVFLFGKNYDIEKKDSTVQRRENTTKYDWLVIYVRTQIAMLLTDEWTEKLPVFRCSLECDYHVRNQRHGKKKEILRQKLILELSANTLWVEKIYGKSHM